MSAAVSNRVNVSRGSGVVSARVSAAAGRKGPTKSLAEADELLCGPLGDSLGLRRKKIVLPWTLEGPDSRSPPDADQTVEIFADAAPTVRECWLSVLAQFADQPAGREYIVYHNVDAGETVRLTYGQVGRMVEQIAWALQGMGLQKGDRVGIAMRNLPEFMPIWWAVTSMGYVVVPLNAWLMKGELEWCIKDAGCKVLFIDQERLERLGVSDGKGLADTAASAGGSVTHFVLVRSKLSEAAAGALRSKGIHTVPFHHLLDPTAPPKLPDVEVSMFDNSQILYSSGTTGHPKGVLHSNLQWAQQVDFGGIGLATELLTFLILSLPSSSLHQSRSPSNTTCTVLLSGREWTCLFQPRASRHLSLAGSSPCPCEPTSLHPPPPLLMSPTDFI